MRAHLLQITVFASLAFGNNCHFQSIVFDRSDYRTSMEWLREYLEIRDGQERTEEDLQLLRLKLLTTEVFTDAELKCVSVSPNSQQLVVSLKEKWTTIPVVRGAYGGGTPLAVVGVYDTHSFGKLWTLGAEGQRYGSAPWGGVVWARAPRFLAGNDERGLEFWRQFRLRQLFDDRGDKSEEIRGDWTMIRALTMSRAPLAKSKWGLDFRYRYEQPIEATTIQHQSHKQYTPLARFVFDTMSVDNLRHEGWRIIALSGPVFEKEGTYSKQEIEAFYFLNESHSHVNFGFHLVAGGTSAPSFESQYFLGGFDSIRGLPDGYLRGKKAAYFNAEARHVSWRTKYVWFQTAAFADLGTAFDEAKSASLESSYGIGVRLAVPQVYRLLWRIDYAWSESGRQGISLGMNQFFQPYKPL